MKLWIVFLVIALFSVEFVVSNQDVDGTIGEFVFIVIPFVVIAKIRQLF